MFNNLHELLLSLPTEKQCRDYLIEQRWSGCPVCPYCGFSEKTYVIEGGKRFKCGASQDVCGKKYSVTVGTIFESSRIPLTKWLNAVYVVTAHKKGISSHQLGRDLGVTQRTAWFMIHRIREMMKTVSEVMDGTIEADETYMGRKYRSDYKGLSETEIEYNVNSKGSKSKGAVLGLADRKTHLVLIKAFPKLDRPDVNQFLIENVKQGSNLHTDETHLYNPLEGYYHREKVKHGAKQWVVKSISAGKVHTNNIENFWSVMKRGVHGIYHQISYKHLQRYCDEFSYRYNTRKLIDADRFVLSLQNMERRLTWVDLTKKD